MMNKARINRLATGVPGFDAVLGGGLPEFSFNLLAGPPGSGKTTLAHQMMFALATPERSALYFTTLGESPLKMLRYQQQFAFFDSDQVNRSVHFISLGDDTAAGDVGSVLGRIADEVKKHTPASIPCRVSSWPWLPLSGRTFASLSRECSRHWPTPGSLC
jgi:circadian clock protein KaiC